jgi:hypothetical protein
MTTEVVMPPRQARLRSIYSDWYAGIAPGTWHHALWVREKALANLRHGKPQWETPARERVLSDSHFEFQGGAGGDDARGGERRMIQGKD